MTFLPTAPRPTQRRLRPEAALAVFLGLRQSEREFQRQVIRYARLMGWKVWYVTDSRKSPAGWPDLVMTRRPRLIVAELKSERGRVTGDQLACIQELRACGIDARTWRPSSWKEIEQCLR